MSEPRVRDHLKKEDIWTIPNIISMFRIALIPFIIWVYCGVQNYTVAMILILVSGVSDIVDGKIARKFNMVSNFGKFLDPVADKMTQGSLIICLISRYKWMIALIIFFILKEAVMFLAGYIVFKNTDSVNSAKWHGKLSTVVLYFVMIILLLFTQIPEVYANILILICAGVMAMSLWLYLDFYYKLVKAKKCGK
ncbi:MAG: CDP-alcohol phosphatidyltransferase family protein [Oscillospiraceae bacterium]|nr:CDP-alcohol phosphatidyltransferase family protein [Oscillospiraceae bacterium]